MKTTNSGSARYDGLGKDGKGHVSTQSGALKDQPYGFQTRFEDAAGTNPEELIAAAHASARSTCTTDLIGPAGQGPWCARSRSLTLPSLVFSFYFGLVNLALLYSILMANGMTKKP